ncbi:30200_t:CDS:1, partial [Gigaspora margarita]
MLEKCLDEAKNYWKMIDDKINYESEDSSNESLDFCLEDKDF